jgi:hypothetical protein
MEIAPPSKRQIVELKVASQVVGSAISPNQLESVQAAAKESQYESIRRSAHVKQQKLRPQQTDRSQEKSYSDVRIDAKVTKSRRFLTDYCPSGTS